MSVRLRLTLSYAALVLLAGVLLLGAVWVFLLRYVPDRAMLVNAEPDALDSVFPVRSRLLEAFAPAAALVLVFLLLLGLVGGWFLAGRMLAPLTRITATTRAAGRGSLSARVALEGRSDEFRELADSFDAMMSRIESHVTEQRRFAANAAHELRTPLAISKALLDVAEDDPARTDDVLVERLRSVNARAIELTEAMLVLSQVDQQDFARERVDLSLVAEQAVETLVPLAEGHDVALECVGGPADALGSPALLLQLCTNLLHNAIVHNLPAHGSARVSTGYDGSTAFVCVESTGRELSPALVASMSEPFHRGTDRLRSDHGGVGLGLAIATSIIGAHGGSLLLVPRPGGGLRATVRLSAAAYTGPAAGAR